MRHGLLRASLAAAVLAAPWAARAPLARAGEEGAHRIPSGGEDVVRLDDGRTLRCRVAGKEGTNLRLEFAPGAVTVPQSRVARVLLFRDFDPAPRDAAEREKAGRGLVRWAGDWVTPVRSKELRGAFLAAEAKAVAESRPALDWGARNVVRSPPFVVETDLPLARAQEYADLLQKYLECLRTHLQLSIAKATAGRSIPVRIHRDFEGFREEALQDGAGGEHTVGYFLYGGTGGNEHLVLFDIPGDEDTTLDVLLHEATHMFLHFAGGDAAESAGLWLHEGLAEYMGGSTWKYRKFQPGALQEDRLLWFQEMLEAGRVIPLDRLLRPPLGDRSEFGLDHYAQSWCFVHFLLHGRQGSYRGAFRDLLKEGKFGTAAEYLLYRLERKDFQKVQKEFEDYARGLRLTGGRAHAWRALGRAREGEEEKAQADLAHAVRRAGTDGPTFVTAARAAAELGRRGQAADLFAQALEGDPLDAGLRLERAAVAEGAEALGEARFAAALAPEDAAVLARAAREVFRMEAAAAPGLPPAGDLGKEASDLAARVASLSGGRADPALAARAAIARGEFGQARTTLERARGRESGETVGLLAALRGIEGDGAAMADCLQTYRKVVRALLAALPRRGRSESPPEARMFEKGLVEAVHLAVTLCLRWEKGEAAAEALEAYYDRDPPGTEGEWVLWARAAAAGPVPTRTAEVVESGLRAFPRSPDLLRLRETLPKE